MKIAVAGAGLAGLGALWHLTQFPHIEAVLFDPQGIGGGASGVSTGLLHPFPGKKALRSWSSREGMEKTFGLLAIAEKALGRPVFERSGIFRPAISDQQKRDFRLRAEEDEEAFWREDPPGLWIPGAATVYSRLYLEGLWKACAEKGAVFRKEKIESLHLDDFDLLILALGGDALGFEHCGNLPLKATKGQTLLCRWPEKLPCSLVSEGHITPTEDPGFCQIGSTYEREFSSLEPVPEKALGLLEKAARFHPPARHFEVAEIRAGVRISRPQGYRPICAKIAPKAWVFTGLGSRGLLYHAWIGNALAEAVASGWDELRPNDLYKSLSVNG